MRVEAHHDQSGTPPLAVVHYHRVTMGPLPLDYAPAGRRSRRRTLLLALAVLVCLASAAGLHQRARLKLWYTRASMLYAQRQCMSYSPPADQILFEKCPTAEIAARYITTGKYKLLTVELRATWPGSGWPDHCVERVPPDCLTRLAASGVPNYRSGPAFMHRLRNPAGVECLVVIQICTTYGSTEKHNIELDFERIAPGTWSANPSRNLAGCYFFNEKFLAALNRPSATVRLYAGQADPADASHFTIGYEIDGQRGTIDARLQADGKIHYTIPTGPAADSSSRSTAPTP